MRDKRKDRGSMLSLEDAGREAAEPMETAVCRRLYLEELLGQLSGVECEIVELSARGAGCRDIAVELGISTAEIFGIIQRMRGRLATLGYSSGDID